MSETPGPGAYAVSKPSDWLRKTYPPKKKQTSASEVRFLTLQYCTCVHACVYMYVCLNKEFKIHPGSTKIFEISIFFLPSSPSQFLSGRVLYTRQPTAPSIPAAGQCHGYEEGEDGTLLPQEQPQHDPTMGPAYYNTSHVGGGREGGERG